MPLYKQVWNMLVLLIIGVVSAYLISLVTKKDIWTGINSIETIKDTTWATIEKTTWTWSNNTWVIIEPPKEPRLYLDYIIQYWSWWIDYIIKSPTNQPDMSSKAWSENTKRMHDYLYNNRIKFNIPKTNKKWYIMFVTSKPISNISNMFLWIDGLTIWWLDKKKSLSVDNQNEYLYKLNEISLIGNNDYRFSKDLSWKSNVFINAVVGETNNKVEKIIIFFQ